MRYPLLFTLLTSALAPLAASATGGDIFVQQGVSDSIVISNVPQSEAFDLLLAAPVEAPASVAVAAALPAPVDKPLSGTLLERARRYVPWVQEAANASQVDARLLHAVIATESAYNPQARSPKGAVGMMQLLPATARRYGVSDLYDVQQNIGGGARYLADLLRQFGNDTKLALAAYNAGENAVLRYGGRVPPYAETEAYVPRVLDFYRRFTPIAQ